jgi:hypothetical protein
VSWSYSGSPGSSLKDAVRFYIGDTNSAKPLFSDEEILFLLVEFSDDPLSAAAAAAEALAASFSRTTTKSIGSLSLSQGEMTRNYSELAEALWLRAGGRKYPLHDLYSGGLSKAEKETRDAEEDLPRPFFSREMLKPTEASDDEDELL